MAAEHANRLAALEQRLDGIILDEALNGPRCACGEQYHYTIERNANGAVEAHFKHGCRRDGKAIGAGHEATQSNLTQLPELKRYEHEFWGDDHYMSLVGEDKSANIDHEEFYIADHVDAILAAACELLSELGNHAEASGAEVVGKAEAFCVLFKSRPTPAGLAREERR